MIIIVKKIIQDGEAPGKNDRVVVRRFDDCPFMPAVGMDFVEDSTGWISGTIERISIADTDWGWAIICYTKPNRHRYWCDRGDTWESPPINEIVESYINAGWEEEKR